VTDEGLNPRDDREESNVAHDPYSFPIGVFAGDGDATRQCGEPDEKQQNFS
jgi:hypothetical protein